MKVIHSVYTFTNRKQYKKQSYLDMQLIEAYTLILSCAYARRYIGHPHLYCDIKFYEFIKEHELEKLWDNIDYTAFENIPKDIDYSVFWTYPKMYIHSIQNEPFVALDIDLFMWKHMRYFKEPDLDFIYAHPEMDTTGVEYPDFHKDKRYEDIFKDLKIVDNDSHMNTAILYCKDNSFYKELMEMTTEFARRVSKEGKEDKYNDWNHTIFCEQRVIKSLINKYNLNAVPQYDVTFFVNGSKKKKEDPWFDLEKGSIFHLWGMKNNIGSKYKINLENKFYNLISIEFPEYIRYAETFKKNLKN